MKKFFVLLTAVVALTAAAKALVAVAAENEAPEAMVAMMNNETMNAMNDDMAAGNAMGEVNAMVNEAAGDAGEAAEANTY